MGCGRCYHCTPRARVGVNGAPAATRGPPGGAARAAIGPGRRAAASTAEPPLALQSRHERVSAGDRVYQLDARGVNQGVSVDRRAQPSELQEAGGHRVCVERLDRADRKSTRLNSSHDQISYAVFCLKKKKEARYRG